jgi:hypothetical protein
MGSARNLNSVAMGAEEEPEELLNPSMPHLVKCG